MYKMNKAVLIVDDNALGREMLKTAFEGYGYIVFTAKDANEGLERIKTVQIDCIILDLILPGMDGFGMLVILKGDPKTKDIPVVVLSGRESDAEKEEAIKLGAVNYLIKHQTPPLQVVKVIKNLIG